MTLSWKLLAGVMPLVYSIIAAAHVSVDQGIPAIVSTAWLSNNINASNLLVEMYEMLSLMPLGTSQVH